MQFIFIYLCRTQIEYLFVRQLIICCLTHVEIIFHACKYSLVDRRYFEVSQHLVLHTHDKKQEHSKYRIHKKKIVQKYFSIISHDFNL